MMTAAQERFRERIGASLASGLVQLGLVCLFLFGLEGNERRAMIEPLKLFNIAPPLPEPETVRLRPPPRVSSDTRNQRFTPREEGGSSPPSLRSQATPVVAPEPVVPLPVKPPIVAAPFAGNGADSSQGAALVRGPGTGSGGLGDGTGSGLGGGGRGGGGYGAYTPPRLIRGRLRNSDYPAGLGEAGIEGTVGIVYVVRADGRVSDCRIRTSSGSDVLDETTCRLIEQRFLFEPSRDPRGRPIDSRIVENHSWIIEDEPEAREPARRRRW
ncbi:MAG: energy transducer TonB [Sphingosinicella sp.]